MLGKFTHKQMIMQLQTFEVGGTNSFTVLLTCELSFSWRKQPSV